MDTLYSTEVLTKDRINNLRNEALMQRTRNPFRRSPYEQSHITKQLSTWISNRGSNLLGVLKRGMNGSYNL